MSNRKHYHMIRKHEKLDNWGVKKKQLFKKISFLSFRKTNLNINSHNKFTQQFEQTTTMMHYRTTIKFNN